MREIVIVTLVGIAVLFLSACMPIQDPAAMQTEEAPADGPAPPPTSIPEATPAPLPPGIPWDEASLHIGEHGTVCGPVVTIRCAPDLGYICWLNLGVDYPDPNRFQVVISGADRANFPQPPEDYYRGAYICSTGTIKASVFTSATVPEMEIDTPSSIVIQ